MGHLKETVALTWKRGRGVQKRDIVREPGVLYLNEEGMAQATKVEAFADNSFGASLSTLTERLEAGEI